uniref:Putative secreted protein n=1 Tax=Ixodes ricinus TaxID=34613 RepID=A0A6B0TYD1_IXORI
MGLLCIGRLVYNRRDSTLICIWLSKATILFILCIQSASSIQWADLVHCILSSHNFDLAMLIDPVRANSIWAR